MAPPPYPDFRWFLRTLRVLPVVAIAALAGGIIGGFSIFAIDLAVTAPPNHGVPPEPGSKLARETTNNNAAASSAAIRSFDAATPTTGAAASAATAPVAPVRVAPALAAPADRTAAFSTLPAARLSAVAEPASVSAQDISLAQLTAGAMTPTQSGLGGGAIAIVHPQRTIFPTEPQQQTPSSPQIAVAPQQTSWPDALSRAHYAAPMTAATAAPQAAKKPQQRRVAIKPPQTRNARVGATAANAARPLYDDYSGRDEQQNAGRDSGRGVADGQRSASYPTTRYSTTNDRTMRRPHDVRRQPPLDIRESNESGDGRLYDHSGGRDDDGDGLPPQPPPPLPFFGLFGGDR